MKITHERKRKHSRRKNRKGIHRRKFGEIRQAVHTEKWHGFTLQRGMYFGEDEDGLWATYGLDAVVNDEYGIVMYRAKADTHVERESDYLDWKRCIEWSKTAQEVNRRIITTTNLHQKAKNAVMPDGTVGKVRGTDAAKAVLAKHEDPKPIPLALRIVHDERVDRETAKREQDRKLKRMIDGIHTLSADDPILRRTRDAYYAEHPEHMPVRSVSPDEAALRVEMQELLTVNA